MKKSSVAQMEPWFDKKEARAVFDYMKSGGWIMEFRQTQELEKRLAELTDSKYAIMTVNGTVALLLALKALGVGPGDEVVVPNLTMIATPNACVLAGASPVLVDVDPQNLCLDLTAARKRIGSKTKAMIYVPLNGRSHDMRKVKKFCKENKLFLIEDAAQALGSFCRGQHLGTWGDIGTLSFSTQKIITTGQGGAMLTNRKRLANRLLKIKNFGRLGGGNDTHDEWGWNFRFTDLQAVVGLEQMKKLPERIRRKKEIYKRYLDELKHISRIRFIETNLDETTPWFVDIYVDEPDALAKYLQNKGIGTRRIYPAVSSQKIYKSNLKFPIAERFAGLGLWLPSSSQLTNRQIDHVTGHIRAFFNSVS
ncbi:aminotransferase [Candidatus Amesbacteria bacterium RIFCSPLOWO2_01_FULL_49_25]|nr:MAG: aminotransferase [Candidatus Amesbacteria bacterium RIFCSPLOWO2_01_FULL_49_25]